MAEKALCTIPGCGKQRHCRGLCKLHYQQYLRGAPHPLTPKALLQSTRKCRVEGCDRPGRTRELCDKHYLLFRRHGRTHTKYSKPGAALAFCEQVLQSDTTDCILWPFPLKEGYGFVRPPRPGQRPPYPQMKASRYICIQAHGPANGLHALHTCHNSRCVNPKHLYFGTNDRNIQDKLEAGRQPRGTAIFGTKLNEEQVREIRSLDLSEYKSMLAACRDLAPKYGVSMYTIKGVLVGSNWKYVQAAAS